MSELATKNRAEELAEAIVRDVPRLPLSYDELIEALGISEASVQYECDLAKLIEQALLAERRLVWKRAEEMVLGMTRPTEASDRVGQAARILQRRRMGRPGGSL